MSTSSNAVKAAFVPSNDNIAFANSTVQSLDALVSRRQLWEATDYKKANDGLYALLADCLDIFNTKFVNATDADRKTLRIELAARLKAAGVKVQRNTTTLTMFVRFVFNSDRKRAHGYTYVLKAAISRGKTAAELPQYIAEQGGIEEIKRKMVVSEAALAKKVELSIAKDQVAAGIEQATLAPLATLDLPGITGEYAVLLVKPMPNNTVAVVGALSDVEDALYKALVTKMAKHKAAANAETAALSTEATDLLAQAQPSANEAQFQQAA